MGGGSVMRGTGGGGGESNLTGPGVGCRDGA